MYYMYTLKYEVSRMGTPGGVDHKVLKSSPGMIFTPYDFRTLYVVTHIYIIMYIVRCIYIYIYR